MRSKALGRQKMYKDTGRYVDRLRIRYRGLSEKNRVFRVKNCPGGNFGETIRRFYVYCNEE